ncbi:MAG: FecR domain-containing protein [Betaproteobacteria bacterium]|nr:FecR domain-containing protein [Betaproteobacteria bacterium]
MNVQKALCQFAAAASLAALAAIAHAETVGRVLLAAGDTVAVRAGRDVRLQYGSSIEDKDVLRTGAASSLQVRFTDESVVSLRENSQLAIEEYKFAGREDGLEKAFLRLVKGGFRTVTGIIGRTNRSNYAVRAETATIGIRGTDYAVRDCRGDCGAEVKDGLYGSVLGISHGTNKVSVANNAGEFLFGINQHFHVADINSPAQPLLQPPTWVSVRPQGKGQAAQQGGSGTGGEQTSEASGATAESRPSMVAPPPSGVTLEKVDEYQQTETLAETGTPEVLPTFPTSGAGAIAYFPSTFSSGFAFSNATFTNNGSGQLGGFVVSSPFSVDGNIGSAQVFDSGFSTAAGNIHWGRWFGAGATVDGMTFTNSNLHYAVGDFPTLPGSGTVIYKPVGGTSPTNSAGTTGTFIDATITVDFLQQQLTVDALSLAFNSATYSLSGSATPFGSDGTAFGSMGGSCTGPSCGSSVFGEYAGSFTGSGAPGLALVYHASDGGPNGDIVGAEALAVAGTVTPPPSLPVGLAVSGDGFSVGGFLLPTSITTSGSGASETLVSFSTVVDPITSDSFSGAVGPSGSDMVGIASSVSGHFGRWIDGTFTFTDAGGTSTSTFTPGTGVHWIYGFDITDPAVFAPKVGGFQFNRVAGTTPTDMNGNIASSFSFGPMFVEFQHLDGVIQDMSWTIAGVQHVFKEIELDLSNTGSSVVFFGQTDVTNLSEGKCIGGPCGSGSLASVFLTGAFAGTAGDHAGMSIASDSAAGPTASVQVYQCPTCASTNTGIPLTTLVFAYAGDTPGFDVTHSGVNLNTSPYMVYSGANLTAFNDISDAANIGTGSNVNTGTLGPINGGFGRWNAGEVTSVSFSGMPVTPPFTPGTGIHWMYGDVAFPENVFTRTGIVNFPHVTGTNPTDSAGNVGSFLSGNIAVDFTAVTASMNAAWTVSGVNYNMTNAPLMIESNSLSVDLNGQFNNHPAVTCINCPSAISTPVEFANVRGQFMGTAGDHIGMGITTFHGPINKATASVQVFSCVGQTGC